MRHTIENVFLYIEWLCKIPRIHLEKNIKYGLSVLCHAQFVMKII